MKKAIFLLILTYKCIWTKKIILFSIFFLIILEIFFRPNDPNTNQGYFSVELVLFYYFEEKKIVFLNLGRKISILK